MINRQNKIIILLGVLMILASLAWMAEPYYTWAQVQNDAHPCRVAVEYEGDSLFKLENMNPGDETTRRVKVIKTGTASAHLYMTWDYVDGNPELGFEGSLYEQLYLQIWETDQDGNRINLIYDDIMAGAPHYQEDFADRLIGYLDHNDELYLEFTVYLPGATTGNVFQGSTLETKLVFYTICSGEENPNISIEKYTNGSDADVPTGPFIPVGGNVTWTYIITNTGNVPLSNVTVTDNKPGVNPVYVSGDINDDDILQVEEVWTYRATGIAVVGQYANIGSVEGTSPEGVTVEDEDPSHYYGITTDETEINIEKYTNGVDADLPTGPKIAVGGNVTWTYVVTNPNTIPLYNVVVTDNRAGVNPVYVSGDINGDNVLQPGEEWTYRAIGIAVSGQYANIGSVVGETINGKVVTDTDPSHYFGFTINTPDIDIEKYTNGIDADVPTGPFILVGGPVTWTYIVTNTGNKPLSNITVIDNILAVNPAYIGGDTNGDGIMQVDEVWIYRATGVVIAGQYANIGTVVGTPPEGPNVTDRDPSHYFGITPSETEINIEKATNGVDADLPTGPRIAVGGNVTWTYVVTNPNTIPLFNIVVTDNRTGVTPVYVSGDINGDNVLQPSEIWTYRATGIAVSGQYSNIGSVRGVSAGGKVVTDTDPSHYFGFTRPPQDIDLDPEGPGAKPDDDDSSGIIVEPEDPRSDPPLPRTDGVSIGLFAAGLLLLFAGAFMTKSREEDEEQKA